jgi:hypothetical protein
MEQTRYFIRGRTFESADPALQAALARVYETSERPRCMCVSGGVEMYIAKHAEFVVKRMPGTGNVHHATCQSFEPEPGISGLGELFGEAIVEHAPDQVEIRTDFPLARVAGRPLPRGEAATDPAVVKAPRRRMSLRAVLHFLYDRARFNRWYPGMAGKRSQGVIRHYLLKAAEGVLLKGDTLDKRLYVPEPWRLERREEISERRRSKLMMLMSPEADVQFKMAIVIGQLVEVENTAYGRRLTIKHMPDVPLYIDNKAWERAERAYATILQAVDADVARKPRVLLAALIYAKREHLYQVDTLSLMLVTDQWVPIEGLHELDLIEELQRQNRAFYKPLKADAKSAAGFPNVLLLDAVGGPAHLHVLSAFMEPKERAIKVKTIEALGKGAWAWETDQAMPALPSQRNDRRGEQRATETTESERFSTTADAVAEEVAVDEEVAEEANLSRE